jgi:hypothetical protein
MSARGQVQFDRVPVLGILAPAVGATSGGRR